MQRYIYSILFYGYTTVFLAQYTAIPSAAFEQYLVTNQIDNDNTVNGQVLTSDINTITLLDLSGSPFLYNVQGIEDFTALEDLDISNNNLTSLNISQNLNLKNLNIDSNYISLLDVSNNSALEFLGCFNNTLLNNLDVSNNENLKDLICFGTGITQLDVSNNPQLSYLSFSNVNNIYLGNNLLLTYIGIQGLSFASINVSANSLISDIFIGNTSITNLNFNNNPLLSRLWCVQNSNLREIRLQNGNNMLLNGISFSQPRYRNIMPASSCCIYVDDVANATANWLGQSTSDNFITNESQCSYLATNTFEQQDVLLFPNPATNNFQINGLTNFASITIYDNLGRLAKEFLKPLLNYDISNIRSGIYYVRVKDINNQVFIQKLIIN